MLGAIPAALVDSRIASASANDALKDSLHPFRRTAVSPSSCETVPKLLAVHLPNLKANRETSC